MMESVEYYINEDDDFCLSHHPCLNDILMIGLTLFVNQKFQNYNDMTLTQYSAASRKPNTLKLMLQKQLDANMSLNEIIFPKTSNTKDNLFEISIKFGTKGIYGETNDTRCLEVLLNFIRDKPDFDINFHNRNIETPLLIAIRYKNDDAIKLLLENKADLFRTVQDENEEDETNKILRMPVMKILQINDKDQLENMFNTILKDYKNEVITRCLSMEINNKKLVDILREENLLDARDFLLSYLEQDKGPIPTVTGVHKKGTDSKSKEDHEDHEDQHPHSITCSYCKNEQVSGRCEYCKSYFCNICLDTTVHKCKNHH